MFGCSTWARNWRSATAAAIASASPVLSRPLSTTQRSLTLWSRARYTQPSPPCARQPRTSYCPATSSPGASLGLKEKRVPHCRQNPSVRPARPFTDWPTRSPQLPQTRRISAPGGRAGMGVGGAGAGTGGTSTSPAPSAPREDRPLPDREPRLPRLLPEPVPVPVPADRDADPWPPLAPLEPLMTLAALDGLDGLDGLGALTGVGAMPQTMQYPSSIVPPHPGCAHAAAVIDGPLLSSS